jgi:hypothetical protein
MTALRTAFLGMTRRGSCYAASGVFAFTWTCIFAAPPSFAQGQSPAALTKHFYTGQVGADIRPIFTALGNRLSVPGKERIVLNGILSQPSRSSTGLNVQVIIGNTGSIRLDSTSGPPLNLAFDGQNLGHSAGAPGNSPSAQDEILVDALQYSSAERFLTTAIGGRAPQRLGPAFKLSDPLHSGDSPLICEAFRVLEANQAGWRNPSQAKVYCFDSTTHILAAAFYESASNGVITYTETRFSGWQSIGTPPQRVPGKIELRQNGTVQVSFDVQSATFTAEAADGLFQVH